MSYKDNREKEYRAVFSDLHYPIKRKTLTTEKTLVNGREVQTLDTADLIRIITDQDEKIRILTQDIQCLRGQFEYIYKNGMESYDTEIAAIRTKFPKT